MSTLTNQNQNQSTPKEEEKVISIEVEPIPFPGTIASSYTSTVDLSKLINSIFLNALSDYEGCLILPVQNGQRLECTLYFKDKPITRDGQMKSLIRAGSSSGTRPMDRIQTYNNRIASNRMFTLNDETKQILSKYMPADKNGKINWDAHIFEQVDNVYNSSIVHVKVVGIDLYKILKTIYNSKIDGNRCDYNISLVRPLNSSNYLISIQQLDNKKVEELAQQVGMLQPQGSIIMVRGI